MCMYMHMSMYMQAHDACVPMGGQDDDEEDLQRGHLRICMMHMYDAWNYMMHIYDAYV